MKKSPFYFVHRYPIQKYKYNIIAESHEFQFQNLLSVFP